ncbi:MAG: Rpn family recombination-promoting nuclease/putative transposase [Clostridia bacterium]
MAQNKQEKSKEEVKLLKPKNDIVFQSLFNKNNEEITKNFVQALLDEKIENIVINEDKELVRERPEDKLGILDLQIDVNNNEKIDVEIQLIERKNFAERLLFYFSRLYQSQIKRGGDYSEAKRVVLIAILDYKLSLTEKLEQMETIWQLREKMHPELLLTNYIELRIIEINKVKKMYEKDKENKKAQWILFLDDPNSKEVKEIMEENKDIEQATVTVRKMSEDEKIARLAELREKAIMDEKAIYRAGLERGEKEKSLKIAKELLKRGMSKEEVITIVQLELRDLENIDV